jgi:hypothetical protein
VPLITGPPTRGASPVTASFYHSATCNVTEMSDRAPDHDAPAAEHWMQGLLAPDLSVLRLSGKFPADPVYAGLR